MIDMEVKATDSINWAELTRQLAQRDDLPSAAPARLRQLFLAAIQSGALAPGARLKEIELVNALSVSRTPLREALAALRAEGFWSVTMTGSAFAALAGTTCEASMSCVARWRPWQRSWQPRTPQNRSGR